jgi:hypothetical protein
MYKPSVEVFTAVSMSSKWVWINPRACVVDRLNKYPSRKVSGVEEVGEMFVFNDDNSWVGSFGSVGGVSERFGERERDRIEYADLV